MEQIGFFPINNSSNIYGLTNIKGDMNTRILVATLEKQIFAIEYSENKNIVCNEIHFACIPNNADIISIDAFVRHNNNNDIVLGITFFKNYEESDSNDFGKNIISNNRLEKNICNNYYFNIYSSLSTTNRFDLIRFNMN
ncbi:hypothetical protein BLA29_011225 [Euroglyphus maynei]|uniref:Uncharacterized protein n=1 Tax=Euroglyphus maynei TaxID=6958 RepID=A0A1Y3BKC1_EURMA|nr:hypothetical protein BLA29_011225 [Euroglyphus maynei]